MGKHSIVFSEVDFMWYQQKIFLLSQKAGYNFTNLSAMIKFKHLILIQKMELK